MGQKASPTSFRLVINKDWKSRWFSNKKYASFLQEDVALRAHMTKKLKNMSVDRVDIERSPDVVSIIIKTARPGLIIGRSGAGIEELKKELSRIIKRKTAVRVEVQEVKSPEMSAAIMGEMLAEQLEKRIPYRRAMKQIMIKMLSNKEVKGAKIAVSGRLNGAAIARAEHMEEGSLPLQTLRANVDFTRATAHTTYGTIGVKIWIYKGLIFE